MADTSHVNTGSDYRSDILTDLRSEGLQSTTSKVSRKSIPVAGRTPDIKTRRGESPKAHEPISRGPNRPARNRAQGMYIRFMVY